ncbi:MAG: dipeptide/oligopeptide/nickel ABC transporter ATP-binding protein [Spirochaetae bacterium HGW-Spirochaetae-8]|nr:MAG: dipeptide/oligopeptide/nickel ABC transporter ATP-binding protein [Spirochaetae bacterium HGW-Spirochaetae-8]
MKEQTIKAVNKVAFTVDKGETFGIVGETGAGKTTTVLGILRLLQTPPTEIYEGEVLFKGVNLLDASEAKMRKLRGKEISMIFQDPMTSLNPVIQVGDQVAEMIRLHDKCSRVDAHVKAAAMLETVGIPANRMSEYPHQFSGGMKQRVMIAIALACNPDLLIADEPTTALDVTIQAQVLDLMKKLKKDLQTSIILITHDLGVTAELCDRVAVMYAGSIIEIGNLLDIYNQAKHPYTNGLFSSIPSLENPVDRLSAIPGLMPDPANLPKGCKFYPRCTKRLDRCENNMPSVVALSKTHSVACHLFIDENE